MIGAAAHRPAPVAGSGCEPQICAQTRTLAQFVVEVAAGWSRTHGVDVGAVVGFYALQISH
jgi:hypothetical protein